MANQFFHPAIKFSSLVCFTRLILLKRVKHKASLHRSYVPPCVLNVFFYAIVPGNDYILNMLAIIHFETKKNHPLCFF
jgi:hypothetical protein